MKVDVLNRNGASAGRSVELPDEVFGIEPNEHAVYLAIKKYNAAQRQGTHKAKEKGEITASTRKIKKQKGTGTARAGSLKSPLFRGGGRVFGPRPRNYDIKVNKKVRSLARASALSYKASGGNIKVVEDLKFDAPKTQEFVQLLSGLQVADAKSLFITADNDKNVYLSSRNIPTTKVKTISEVNTYDILYAKELIIAESAVAKFSEL